jgi:hypothetical protein
MTGAEADYVCWDDHVPGCPGPEGGEHECWCGSTEADHCAKFHERTDDEAPS